MSNQGRRKPDELAAPGVQPLGHDNFVMPGESLFDPVYEVRLAIIEDGSYAMAREYLCCRSDNDAFLLWQHLHTEPVYEGGLSTCSNDGDESMTWRNELSDGTRIYG